MFVEINGDGVHVRDAQNLKSLAVEAPNAASLTRLVGLGEADPEGSHAWLDIAAFKAAAASTVDAAAREEWAAGFDSMIAFAAQHGWTDPTGTKVRAHVEITSH
jgi:hypothetical protein